MPTLYSLSTTIPLDANGNPIGESAPTTAEILATSGLLHLFLGSRFLVEDDGGVRRVQVDEMLTFPLTDTVNFHPKSACPQLLLLANLVPLREAEPAIADREARTFCLCGVCVVSQQQLNFYFQEGRLKVRIS